MRVGNTNVNVKLFTTRFAVQFYILHPHTESETPYIVKLNMSVPRPEYVLVEDSVKREQPLLGPSPG